MNFKLFTTFYAFQNKKQYTFHKQEVNKNFMILKCKLKKKIKFVRLQILVVNFAIEYFVENS